MNFLQTKINFLFRRQSLLALRERSLKSRNPSINNSPLSAKCKTNSLDNSSVDEDTDDNFKEEKPIMKKSFERLDSHVSTLHQDVATLSLEVRNAITALKEMTHSTLAHTNPSAKSIPNLPNNLINNCPEEQFLTRSTSQPAEMWTRIMNDSYSDIGCNTYNKSTQTDNSFDFETLESFVLTNPQLVLNILGLNTNNYVHPNTLCAIPEIVQQNMNMTHTWMYENCKSTDALINNNNVNINSVNEMEANPNESCSSKPTTIEENPNPTRRISSIRRKYRNYEQFSSESLTDSHGYVDDFDESCALLITENVAMKKRNQSSSETTIKRRNRDINNFNSNKQVYRFSAGDADKIKVIEMEKGTLPRSTRSLKDT